VLGRIELNKLLTGSASAILGTVIGIAALSFSPATCSCVSPADSYVYYTNLPPGQYELSAGLLQAGLWQNLKEQKLTFGEHALRELYGCAQTEPYIVDCHLIFESSVLLNRGYDFEYVLEPNGYPRSIRVKRFTELRPN
jgi:hypothetical protein